MHLEMDLWQHTGPDMYPMYDSYQPHSMRRHYHHWHRVEMSCHIRYLNLNKPKRRRRNYLYKNHNYWLSQTWN